VHKHVINLFTLLNVIHRLNGIISFQYRQIVFPQHQNESVQKKTRKVNIFAVSTNIMRADSAHVISNQNAIFPIINKCKILIG